MIIDRPIIFTRHFSEKMKLFNLTYWKLFELLPLAIEEKKPKSNNQRYEQYPNIKHIRSGTYILTYAITHDKTDNKEIYLFLTIFDQLMYLQ